MKCDTGSSPAHYLSSYSSFYAGSESVYQVKLRLILFLLDPSIEPFWGPILSPQNDPRTGLGMGGLLGVRTRSELDSIAYIDGLGLKYVGIF